MTLFGRPLHAEELAALAFLLMTLVLWAGALRGEMRWRRWFVGWEADRKARREAELAADAPPLPDPRHRGPWG